jgi:3-oxoacyl-[acyl-carrier-protein] synthase III
VRIAGTGSFLPGSPISIDDVDYFLGELTEAPKKIQDWLQRMKLMMKEMLEIENYYYAIDPVTREFTEDNITMSLKAAEKALKMANILAGEIEFIAYGDCICQDSGSSWDRQMRRNFYSCKLYFRIQSITGSL